MLGPRQRTHEGGTGQNDFLRHRKQSSNLAGPRLRRVYMSIVWRIAWVERGERQVDGESRRSRKSWDLDFGIAWPLFIGLDDAQE